MTIHQIKARFLSWLHPRLFPERHAKMVMQEDRIARQEHELLAYRNERDLYPLRLGFSIEEVPVGHAIGHNATEITTEGLLTLGGETHKLKAVVEIVRWNDWEPDEWEERQEQAFTHATTDVVAAALREIIKTL